MKSKLTVWLSEVEDSLLARVQQLRGHQSQSSLVREAISTHLSQVLQAHTEGNTNDNSN